VSRVEEQLRDLLEMAVGQPPRRVTVEAVRRRVVRHRAVMAAATAAAAAAAVAVAIAVGAAPFRPAAPPAAGPAAPRQFNPLIPYLSFGWLPAGGKLVAGGTGQKVMYLIARPKLDARSEWNLSVYAAGRCTLVAAPRRLTCSAGPTMQISGRAPAVRGHRAFWTGSPDSSLVWQYARGGWAWLYLPFPYDSPLLHNPAKRKAIRRDAVKVARHVRYGAATPPLVFAAQLTGLPSQWRVSSVYYLPDAGVLRASRYTLNAATVGSVTSDGGLQFQNNLPWVEIDPVTARHNSCYFYPGGKVSRGKSTREIINGYPVIVSQLDHGRHQVCAANARGLAVLIAEIGPHPSLSPASLFRHHLRLLGTNPANWTSKPIG
jgi:hypothetical protein